MRNSLTLAADLTLAAILAIGTTCLWIGAMTFPTAIVSSWFPSSFRDAYWITFYAMPSLLMVGIAFTTYLPLKFTCLYNSLLASGSSDGSYPRLRATYFYALPTIWLLIAFLFAVSAFLAMQVYKRHKRCYGDNAVAWAIFVFLWGVPGYIGYLAHRRWPVMERCSNCIKETPRDRDDCLHCHTPFPPPARVATEIIA
jgi:hypothetical protein